MNIDRYKLSHWLNARKVTAAGVCREAGLATADLDAILGGKATMLPAADAERLLRFLDLPESALGASPHAAAEILIWDRRQVESTRRPIQRDGIHFYNYYTLPSPTGCVAPVILDILCPPNRLPMLNNGHLEPAITINLGPGDIHGRWGEELNEVTWKVLGASRDGNPWIVGDSYVEPSFCPHTYSLASDRPAQILSYTVKSPLEGISTRLNSWPRRAAEALLDRLQQRGHASRVLADRLRRVGYTVETLASAARVREAALSRFLDGSDEDEELGLPELKTIAAVLAMDYRLLLPPLVSGDSAGKVHCSVQQSASTVRSYRGYMVASMASAPTLPDLCGLFVRVERPSVSELDLQEAGCLHYLVTGGTLRIDWQAADGTVHQRTLAPFDALWVGPFVAHAFCGDGALIKMGNGEAWGYLDEMELSNTFRTHETVKRSVGDLQDWGYEKPK